MTTKTKALQPMAPQKRTAEQIREAKIAAEWTEYNNKILQAVWAGTENRSALMFEDQGGKLKRVGWPNGYKRELDKATKAHEKLFTRKPDAAPAAKRERVASADYSPKAKVKLLVQGNPKKAGGAPAKRFDLYKNGMTVQEFLDAGGTVADVKWDVDHGYIALS